MIWLEGNVGVIDVSGVKAIVVETGPGAQFGIKLPGEAAEVISQGLKGSQIITAPAGALPPHPGGQR